MRISSIIIALILALGFLSGPVFAEGLQLTPVDNAATLKECGACHLAFPPQMLPERSWKALMDGLSSHFGEDASLPKDIQSNISNYLMAMSADSLTNDEGRVFMRGISSDQTPLRITDTPIWGRIHDEINPDVFKRPKIKSAANCAACHLMADRGVFSEE